MASKRESPVIKKTKAAAPTPDASAAAPAPVKRRPPRIKSKVQVDSDPDIRRRLVAMEAYYLAERRGFAPGHEVEDWIAAEAAIQARLPTDP